MAANCSQLVTPKTIKPCKGFVKTLLEFWMAAKLKEKNQFKLLLLLLQRTINLPRRQTLGAEAVFWLFGFIEIAH